jgi:hypothetical protein
VERLSAICGIVVERKAGKAWDQKRLVRRRRVLLEQSGNVDICRSSLIYGSRVFEEIVRYIRIKTDEKKWNGIDINWLYVLGKDRISS